MGCGLRKMKPLPEENSPGKIYSTLKRPQVETKVGVAYTYRYLDFLIGKDGGTSTLRLSSVRELPEQLQELYQQGFVLAAVHPFIHPCGPESNSLQHQLYRAILVQINDGVERSQPVGPPNKLLLEECLSAVQVPTPELIQGYVKKQMQDFADQGVIFVGFVQEPYGAPCTRIREPETPSLSLHSSPSSVLGSLGSCSPSNPSSPINHADCGAKIESVDKEGEMKTSRPEGVRNQSEINSENHLGSSVGGSLAGISPAASPLSEGNLENSEELTEEDSSYHNNNKDIFRDRKERPRYRRGDGVELLALFNNPPVREGQVKYYTVKVPLRVQSYEDGIKGVEANWLDHMTQHFNNGASLVDGYFHLGNVNDLLPKTVESVFIFQEGIESETNAAAATYDAIVVEQWTIIDGLQVKTDYVPLLQSLATFGWRLTCVLPTPVIKTNSDGSLSTKQIVFLQRPVMSRKKRESKKLIFKTRSKSNKNCIKDVAKNKKKNTINEKESEELKIADDKEKAGKEGDVTVGENTNAEQVEAAGESKKERKIKCEEDTKADAGMVISIEKVISKDGPDKKEDKGAEHCTGVREDRAPYGKGSEENGEPLGKEEVEKVTETVATVETQKETKEKELEGTSKVECVIENGIETDEEKDDNRENKIKTEESVEVIAKETVADPTDTNLNPVEPQE
ncbi:PREDICTED: raftlin-like isoform X1 [Cyprinodon variegatus]|uniref:Raftlin-like n=1 Tax=Cyprinodon variegatus TaxID=28743 RepID=A0A3Q2EDQ7_CYPVA|nr:PREDICTED: raftlin-like isoform X1 [Cyprinodon variegatus]XP_015227398.1 PREDICTED: raftlin-like isoform X1 [Cyprinodon variegatus]